MLDRNALLGWLAAAVTFCVCSLTAAGLALPPTNALLLGLGFSGGTLVAFLWASRGRRWSGVSRRRLFVLLGIGLTVFGAALLQEPGADGSVFGAVLALLAGAIYLGLAAYDAHAERRGGG